MMCFVNTATLNFALQEQQACIFYKSSTISLTRHIRHSSSIKMAGGGRKYLIGGNWKCVRVHLLSLSLSLMLNGAHHLS